MKRVLSLLEELAENDKDKYAKVWKEFGRVLKEGVAEDSCEQGAHRQAVALRLDRTK